MIAFYKEINLDSKKDGYYIEHLPYVNDETVFKATVAWNLLDRIVPLWTIYYIYV